MTDFWEFFCGIINNETKNIRYGADIEEYDTKIKNTNEILKENKLKTFIYITHYYNAEANINIEDKDKVNDEKFIGNLIYELYFGNNNLFSIKDCPCTRQNIDRVNYILRSWDIPYVFVNLNKEFGLYKLQDPILKFR